MARAEEKRVSRPNVLVLMAAYNGSVFIEEQIDTILQQEGVDVHVLIRVDPSTDGTDSLVARRADNDARLSVIDNDMNSPRGAALNFYELIRCASVAPDVTHIAFADQDDLWYRRKLIQATTTLEMHGAWGYSSDVDEWDSETGAMRPLVKSQPQTPWDHLFSSAGPGCTYVMRVDAFRAFQNDLTTKFSQAVSIDYHDWLVYAWVREQGQRWVIDDARTMAYRQHSGNQIGANSGVAAARQRFVALRSGWYLEQVLLIAKFVGATNAPPLKAISKEGFNSYLTIFRNLHHFRRRKTDSIIAALAIAFSPTRNRTTEGHF
ncbi:glycosyltransferase family 2 protein [Calidifontibacter terrae]